MNLFRPIIILCFFALVSCAGSDEGRGRMRIPGSPLTASDSIRLMETIIRYVGDMPDKATYATRQDSAWNEHYAKEAGRHRIDRYFRDTVRDEEFMLVSRIAPSISVKRVAFGIRLHRSPDTLDRYAEVFRTWKLSEEVLRPRADSLFALMVAGEDLSPWYSDKRGDAYIEFPDAETRYDTLARRWVSSREDPIGAMKAVYEKK